MKMVTRSSGEGDSDRASIISASTCLSRSACMRCSVPARRTVTCIAQAAGAAFAHALRTRSELVGLGVDLARPQQHLAAVQGQFAAAADAVEQRLPLSARATSGPRGMTKRFGQGFSTRKRHSAGRQFLVDRDSSQRRMGSRQEGAWDKPGASAAWFSSDTRRSS